MKTLKSFIVSTILIIILYTIIWLMCCFISWEMFGYLKWFIDMPDYSYGDRLLILFYVNLFYFIFFIKSYKYLK